MADAGEVVFKLIGGLIRVVFEEFIGWLIMKIVSHKWLRFFFVFLASVLWFWAAAIFLDKNVGGAIGAALAAVLVTVLVLAGFAKERSKPQSSE